MDKIYSQASLYSTWHAHMHACTEVKSVGIFAKIEPDDSLFIF